MVGDPGVGLSVREVWTAHGQVCAPPVLETVLVRCPGQRAFPHWASAHTQSVLVHSASSLTYQRRPGHVRRPELHAIAARCSSNTHPQLVGPGQAAHADCRPPLRFRPSASRWDASLDCPKRGDRRRCLSNRGTSSPPSVPDSKAGSSGPALALHNGVIVDGEISQGDRHPYYS